MLVAGNMLVEVVEAVKRVVPVDVIVAVTGTVAVSVTVFVNVSVTVLAVLVTRLVAVAVSVVRLVWVLVTVTGTVTRTVSVSVVVAGCARLGVASAIRATRPTSTRSRLTILRSTFNVIFLDRCVRCFSEAECQIATVKLLWMNRLYPRPNGRCKVWSRSTIEICAHLPLKRGCRFSWNARIPSP